MGRGYSILKSPENGKEIYEEIFIENNEKQHKGPPGSYMGKAKFDYAATGEKDMSIKKNDVLIVLREIDELWFEVMNKKSKRSGLVPSAYIIKLDGSPPSVDGYRNVNRYEAKCLLLNPQFKTGAYILRPSSRKGCYALSVRDMDKMKEHVVVKNFLINTIQYKNGEKYCTVVRMYRDIPALIRYFEKNGIGHSRTRLKEPMPEDYHLDFNVSISLKSRQDVEYYGNQNASFDSIFPSKTKEKNHWKLWRNLSHSKTNVKSQFQKYFMVLNGCLKSPDKSLF